MAHGADDGGDPPATSLEQWVESKARGVLGPEVWLARRVVTTRAGGRRGRLVVGYQICSPVPGGPGVVLGMSPPQGSPLDLSDLGGPEEALEDALRRRSAGEGPCRGEVPGRAPLLEGNPADGGRPRLRAPRPTSELTTSTMSLPVP